METLRPKVGVGVMIIKNHKILLGLIKSDLEKEVGELQYQNCWECPGGHVEFGEKLENAAKREVLEETGLIINKLELLRINDDIELPHIHYVTVIFLATDFEGEPKVQEPEKIEKWEWFDLNEVPEQLYAQTKSNIDFYLNNLKEERK